MTERQPSGSPLNPTFRGYIATTMDALVLFEACLCGRLSHVPRRPHDRERSALIRSGHVFIYEEHSSGIKRWTDGVPWSPSRILGNFLLYRELDKPFQPGEKKRAMKKTKVEGGVTKPVANPATSRSSSMSSYGTSMPSNSSLSSYENGGTGRDSERALVGSLVDSYQFKSDGLIKKTISVSYRGVQHHLVSYYNIDDVISGRLATPSATPDFKNLTPRSSLISSGNFRAPVDDHELVVDHGQMAYLATYNPYMPPEYVSMNGINHRSMSVPSLQPYSSWGGMPQPHALGTNYTMAASPTVPISPGVYQPPGSQTMSYGYPQSSQQHQPPPSQHPHLHPHAHQQPPPHPPPPIHSHQQQQQEPPHPVHQHSYNQSMSRRHSTAPVSNDGLGYAAMLDGHGPPGVSLAYDPSQSAAGGAMDSDLGLWANTISEGDHKY